MQDFLAEKWKGLLTRPKDDGVPTGYASDILNWKVFKDRIELRMGEKILGSEITGSGKVTGLKVGKQIDGTELLVRTRGRKIEYYNSNTDTWTEVVEVAGTGNVIDSDADGENMAIAEYQSMAGAFLYISNPNASVYKMPIATPSIVVDMAITNHRGKIIAKKGSMFLMDRKDTNGGSDTTGLYRSVIDRDELSDYSETNNENVGTGDGSNKTFTGTLSLSSKATCHYVRINDTVETFTDDRNGNLVGNKGGTGTINYAKGTFSVTFNTAPANTQAILADYYSEISSSDGILDFSKSAPRQAGEGFVMRQDDGGGKLQDIGSIGGDEYCFHEKNIYKLTISTDDESASNIIYRNNVGIENDKAMVETDDGIYFIDSSNKADPYIRVLQPGYNNPNAIPKSISNNIDLSSYDFSDGGIGKWSSYIVVWGKKSGDSVNNVAFFYDRLTGAWFKTDYRINNIDSLSSILVAGDSGSDNVLALFSGKTDDEANIENYYVTGDDSLGKKQNQYASERFHRFVLAGLIEKQQSYDIYFSYDNQKYVKVGTVDGNASYVDLNNKVSVGNNTVGSELVGDGDIEASPYRTTIKVHTPKFYHLKIKFVATKIGYVSISYYKCKDRRIKGRRLPIKYIQ